MKVAVTGSSGLIGGALVTELRGDGHTVVRLVRRAPAAADEVRWDPGDGRLDPAAFADVDAVVHLSGAGVGDHRWTEQYKRVVYESRIESTRTVVSALVAAGQRPRTLLCASAVGRYGNTGDRVIDERAPVVVLSRRGGLVGRTLPLYRFGLGGRLGSGRQYWPWISLADEVGAIRFLLTADVHGPANLTSPEPVTNAEFTRRLARAVHRPALAFVPRPALRVVLGEFAEEVLGGQRAVPAVLERAGYRFQHADLDAALRWVLAR